jgi:hypothetical protein
MHPSVTSSLPSPSKDRCLQRAPHLQEAQDHHDHTQHPVCVVQLVWRGARCHVTPGHTERHYSKDEASQRKQHCQALDGTVHMEPARLDASLLQEQ